MESKDKQTIKENSANEAVEPIGTLVRHRHAFWFKLIAGVVCFAFLVTQLEFSWAQGLGRIDSPRASKPKTPDVPEVKTSDYQTLQERFDNLIKTNLKKINEIQQKMNQEATHEQSTYQAKTKVDENVGNQAVQIQQTAINMMQLYQMNVANSIKNLGNVMPMHYFFKDGVYTEYVNGLPYLSKRQTTTESGAGVWEVTYYTHNSDRLLTGTSAYYYEGTESGKLLYKIVTEITPEEGSKWWARNNGEYRTETAYNLIRKVKQTITDYRVGMSDAIVVENGLQWTDSKGNTHTFTDVSYDRDGFLTSYTHTIKDGNGAVIFNEVINVSQLAGTEENQGPYANIADLGAELPLIAHRKHSGPTTIVKYTTYVNDIGSRTATRWYGTITDSYKPNEIVEFDCTGATYDSDGKLTGYTEKLKTYIKDEYGNKVLKEETTNIWSNMYYEGDNGDFLAGYTLEIHDKDGVKTVTRVNHWDTTNGLLIGYDQTYIDQFGVVHFTKVWNQTYTSGGIYSFDSSTHVYKKDENGNYVLDYWEYRKRVSSEYNNGRLWGYKDIVTNSIDKLTRVEEWSNISWYGDTRISYQVKRHIFGQCEAGLMDVVEYETFKCLLDKDAREKVKIVSIRYVGGGVGGEPAYDYTETEVTEFLSYYDDEHVKQYRTINTTTADPDFKEVKLVTINEYKNDTPINLTINRWSSDAPNVYVTINQVNTLDQYGRVCRTEKTTHYSSNDNSVDYTVTEITVVEEWDFAGRQTTLEVTTSNSYEPGRSTTDTITISYGGFGLVSGETIARHTLVRDGQGNIAAEYDESWVKEYTYNSIGKGYKTWNTTFTDRYGQTFVQNSNALDFDAAGRVTLYEVNIENTLNTTDGGTVTIKGSQRVSQAFDTFGRLSQRQTWVDWDGIDYTDHQIENFTYNENGQAEEVDVTFHRYGGGLDLTENYHKVIIYDKAGRPLEETIEKISSSRPGLVETNTTTYEYDPVTGQVTIKSTQTNIEGSTTQNYYIYAGPDGVTLITPEQLQELINSISVQERQQILATMREDDANAGKTDNELLLQHLMNSGVILGQTGTGSIRVSFSSTEEYNEYDGYENPTDIYITNTSSSKPDEISYIHKQIEYYTGTDKAKNIYETEKINRTINGQRQTEEITRDYTNIIWGGPLYDKMVDYWVTETTTLDSYYTTNEETGEVTLVTDSPCENTTSKHIVVTINSLNQEVGRVETVTVEVKDENGNVIYSKKETVETITGYDSQNRVIQTTTTTIDSLFGDREIVTSTIIGFDAFGNPIGWETIRQSWDGNGNYLGAEKDKHFVLDRNENGQETDGVSIRTDRNGEITTVYIKDTQYNNAGLVRGYIQVVIDAEGNAYTTIVEDTEYDVHLNVIQRQSRIITPSGISDLTERYYYDGAGQVCATYKDISNPQVMPENLFDEQGATTCTIIHNRDIYGRILEEFEFGTYQHNGTTRTYTSHRTNTWDGDNLTGVHEERTDKEGNSTVLTFERDYEATYTNGLLTSWNETVSRSDGRTITRNGTASYDPVTAAQTNYELITDYGSITTTVTVSRAYGENGELKDKVIHNILQQGSDIVHTEQSSSYTYRGDVIDQVTATRRHYGTISGEYFMDENMTTVSTVLSRDQYMRPVVWNVDVTDYLHDANGRSYSYILTNFFNTQTGQIDAWEKEYSYPNGSQDQDVLFERYEVRARDPITNLPTDVFVTRTTDYEGNNTKTEYIHKYNIAYYRTEDGRWLESGYYVDIDSYYAVPIWASYFLEGHKNPRHCWSSVEIVRQHVWGLTYDLAGRVTSKWSQGWSSIRVYGTDNWHQSGTSDDPAVFTNEMDYDQYSNLISSRSEAEDRDDPWDYRDALQIVFGVLFAAVASVVFAIIDNNNGNTWGSTDWGLAIFAPFGIGNSDWCRDGLQDRVKGDTVTHTRYAYDSQGNLVQTHSYTRNNLQRSTSVTDWTGDFVEGGYKFERRGLGKYLDTWWGKTIKTIVYVVLNLVLGWVGAIVAAGLMVTLEFFCTGEISWWTIAIAIVSCVLSAASHVLSTGAIGEALGLAKDTAKPAAEQTTGQIAANWIMVGSSIGGAVITTFAVESLVKYLYLNGICSYDLAMFWGMVLGFVITSAINCIGEGIGDAVKGDQGSEKPAFVREDGTEVYIRPVSYFEQLCTNFSATLGPVLGTILAVVVYIGSLLASPFINFAKELKSGGKLYDMFTSKVFKQDGYLCDLANAFKDTINGVTQFIKALSQLKPAATIWQVLNNIVIVAFEAVVALVSTLFNAVKTIVEACVAAVKMVIDAAVWLVKQVLNVVQGFFELLNYVIPGIGKFVGGIVDLVRGIVEGIANIATNVLKAVQFIVRAVGLAGKAVVEFIMGLLKSNSVSEIISKIARSGVFRSIKALLEGAEKPFVKIWEKLNKILEDWERVIKALPRLRVVDAIFLPVGFVIALVTSLFQVVEAVLGLDQIFGNPIYGEYKEYAAKSAWYKSRYEQAYKMYQGFYRIFMKSAVEAIIRYFLEKKAKKNDRPYYKDSGDTLLNPYNPDSGYISGQMATIPGIADELLEKGYEWYYQIESLKNNPSISKMEDIKVIDPVTGKEKEFLRVLYKDNESAEYYYESRGHLADGARPYMMKSGNYIEVQGYKGRQIPEGIKKTAEVVDTICKLLKEKGIPVTITPELKEKLDSQEPVLRYIIDGGRPKFIGASYRIESADAMLRLKGEDAVRVFNDISIFTDNKGQISTIRLAASGSEGKRDFMMDSSGRLYGCEQSIASEKAAEELLGRMDDEVRDELIDDGLKGGEDEFIQQFSENATTQTSYKLGEDNRYEADYDIVRVKGLKGEVDNGGFWKRLISGEDKIEREYDSAVFVVKDKEITETSLYEKEDRVCVATGDKIVVYGPEKEITAEQALAETEKGMNPQTRNTLIGNDKKEFVSEYKGKVTCQAVCEISAHSGYQTSYRIIKFNAINRSVAMTINGEKVVKDIETAVIILGDRDNAEVQLYDKGGERIFEFSTDNKSKVFSSEKIITVKDALEKSSGAVDGQTKKILFGENKEEFIRQYKGKISYQIVYEHVEGDEYKTSYRVIKFQNLGGQLEVNLDGSKISRNLGTAIIVLAKEGTQVQLYDDSGNIVYTVAGNRAQVYLDLKNHPNQQVGKILQLLGVKQLIGVLNDKMDVVDLVGIEYALITSKDFEKDLERLLQIPADEEGKKIVQQFVTSVIDSVYKGLKVTDGPTELPYELKIVLDQKTGELSVAPYADVSGVKKFAKYGITTMPVEIIGEKEAKPYDVLYVVSEKTQEKVVGMLAQAAKGLEPQAREEINHAIAHINQMIAESKKKIKADEEPPSFCLRIVDGSGEGALQVEQAEEKLKQDFNRILLYQVAVAAAKKEFEREISSLKSLGIDTEGKTLAQIRTMAERHSPNAASIVKRVETLSVEYEQRLSLYSAVSSTTPLISKQYLLGGGQAKQLTPSADVFRMPDFNRGLVGPSAHQSVFTRDIINNVADRMATQLWQFRTGVTLPTTPGAYTFPGSNVDQRGPGIK